MVQFFDILGSNSIQSGVERETLAFNSLPDFALGAVPLSRAEQDALYLSGKGVEREDGDDLATDDSSFSQPNWFSRIVSALMKH